MSESAISWVGNLAPKQGLVFDPPNPPPTDFPAAKHYIAMNSGNKPVKLIVTMITQED